MAQGMNPQAVQSTELASRDATAKTAASAARMLIPAALASEENTMSPRRRTGGGAVSVTATSSYSLGSWGRRPGRAGPA